MERKSTQRNKIENVKIGSRIRHLRQLCSISQPTVARQIGISASAYCLVESGKRSLDIADLVAISKIYGVSLHWLANGVTGDPHNDTGPLCCPVAMEVYEAVKTSGIRKRFLPKGWIDDGQVHSLPQVQDSV